MDCMILFHMAPDSAATSEFTGEVMASIDAEQFVIADLACEKAWIEMPLGDVAVLGEWR